MHFILQVHFQKRSLQSVQIQQLNAITAYFWDFIVRCKYMYVMFIHTWTYRIKCVLSIFGIFRVKKSRFYAKKSYFFSNFREARAGCVPPGSAPGIVVKHIQQHIYTTSLHVSREVVPIDRDKEYRSAEGWGVGEPFNTHFWVWFILIIDRPYCDR
jgi:hypothetical protein